jgi:hypothetical protein
VPAAPPPPPGFVSNTPGATVVDVGTPARPDLVLISSNLLQSPSGGQIFQQWIGEVKNNGAAVACGLLLDVTFRSASGSQLGLFTPFTAAPPYQLSGLSVTINCLAPGEIGTFYDNGFVATPVDLGAVTRIETEITALGAGSAIPAPHTPIVASHVAQVFGRFAVEGTLTGNAGAIYNIAIDVFPRDASGLVLGWLIDTDLEQLDPGGVFPFSTTGVATSFSLYRVFLDFIDGPKPAIASAAPAFEMVGDPAIEAAWRLRAARRAAAERNSAIRYAENRASIGPR